MDFKDLTKEETIREIRKYLQQQIDLVERQELDSEAFSKPSWPYYQANNLGKKKAFRKILEALPNG
jgi:hypothetical protein